MSRIARLKGEDAIYHIIQRGNDKKNIFKDDMDKLRYLHTLKREHERSRFEIYCYCLMDNHVHMLLGSAGTDISEVMKCINVSYVQYFNKKYERCGHLFQDRFKSEIIDTDAYLLQASKYIHLNPVNARMVNNPIHYPWSSYGYYTGQSVDKFQIINTSVILSAFALDFDKASSAYSDFVEVDVIPDDSYIRFFQMDDVDGGKIREDLIKDILQSTMSREDKVLALQSKVGLSCRDISRCMDGLSSSTVHRIIHKASKYEN